MIRSPEQWNRLVIVDADAESVTVELRIQKPNTALWAKQASVPATIEILQQAFEHVGHTWSQIFKEEAGPVFDATRVVTVLTPEKVIILRWDVHHIQGVPYQINDDLEVCCIAFVRFDAQLIIEHPY
ncbi:hypothetical protein K8942_00540 [Candidatus Peribacteria bacterium]|nr:MAG: hypothetical protein K8942_00540 [Candidatus Peribacteria bacterium]